jgi:hypothetical protein
VVKKCLDWIDELKSGDTKKREICLKFLPYLPPQKKTHLPSKQLQNHISRSLKLKWLELQKEGECCKKWKNPLIQPIPCEIHPGQVPDFSPGLPLSESISSDAAIRKKKKVDEPDLPWITHNKFLGVELRPELWTTLELLQAWSVNPKQVKVSIINTLGCPAFPNSKWINLDNIFSGFYSTSTNNQ